MNIDLDTQYWMRAVGLPLNIAMCVYYATITHTLLGVVISLTLAVLFAITSLHAIYVLASGGPRRNEKETK